MRASFRVRPFVLATAALFAGGGALALAAGAGASSPYSASASFSSVAQYLGDSTGTVFTITVKNTGTDASIGAVEVQRPSNGWTIVQCGAGTTGWSVQTADPKCRFRSVEATTDDILPGQTRDFTVKATTQPGTENRVGDWDVTVSRSNQFDNPSLLTAAAEVNNGLTVTAYTWEVVDAVVANAPVAAGSACPAANKSAPTGSTRTIVVCGRNHASVPLTPVAAWSSLGGTFVASPGTFSSGLVPANSGPVVVGSWTGATVSGTPGTGRTVVVTVGSAANQTSPATTLGGYEAINGAPVANADAYSVAEDSALSVPAPGVLGNDTDPEGYTPLTAVLATGPAHAASFALHADGSFDYTPDANYFGGDAFTYWAHDDIQNSTLAGTVTITVTGVDDPPVNTAPASVTTAEDTPYVFGPSTLSVADIDSGALDVSTHLTVAHATLTAGTSGVTVTGNGTGDVTITGPVSAVAAALNGLTLSPAADYNGGTSIAMVTSDLGHTGSGGPLTDSDAIAVTVTAVNDPPSFTAGGDQTVAEDAGTQSVPGWATAVSPGPANESGQLLDFQVTNDNAALFQTAPAVSAGGTLTYRANPDAYGVAHVTVTLHDDGGGSDTSAPASFTITVTPVNDAPAAADQSYTAQANMKIHLTGLLAGASDTHDAGEPAYTPAFTLASVTPLSCAGCTVSNVAADGSFDLDPPAGGTGSYTLSYTITDTGYPAPGATSAPATITVSVSGPVIWFVDAAASAPGTGRLSAPFSALSSATAVAGTGQRIFVASGTVTGNVTQATSGWLVGQGVSGASFDSVMGITPPAGTIARPAINGTRPAITGGVTLADNSVVRGVSLAPPSGTAALTGSGADGVTVGETSATATGARAVDVQSSQGSTIALSSVTATGGTSGVYLKTVNTTTPGSVSVGGGTIGGSTADGVHLENVATVALSNLTVSNAAGNGISGSGASGLTLTDVTVSGSGVHGIALSGSTGTTTLTRVTAAGSAGDNMRFFGSTGTATLTVGGSTFRDNDATTGGNGLLVEADGSAAYTFTSTNNSYLGNHTDGLAVFAQSSAPMSATVSSGSYATAGGVGLDIEANGTGGLAYSVTGGTVTGTAASGAPVVVYKATGATGTGANALAGTIRGMTISNGNSTNAPGIWVHAEGAGASRVAILDNSLSAVSHNGILVTAGNGSSAMDATITGNTVDLSTGGVGTLQGIEVDSGTLTSDTTSVCADVRSNTVTDPTTSDIRVRNRQAGTHFRLPGYVGSATSTSAVVSFLTAQNTVSDAAATVGSSPGFAGGAACAAP